MTDQFLGEIRAFGFNFAPFGWAQCNGQILAISQFAALFSLLGTTYGGNGINNFALPNLQGNVPIHWGSGAGLNPVVIGEQLGESTVTLTTLQIPAHVHSAMASTEAGDDTNTPAATTTLGLSAPDPLYSKLSTDPLVAFSPKSIALTGSNLPHENMQPYLGINFCIALQGIFPARN